MSCINPGPSLEAQITGVDMKRREAYVAGDEDAFTELEHELAQSAPVESVSDYVTREEWTKRFNKLTSIEQKLFDCYVVHKMSWRACCRALMLKNRDALHQHLRDIERKLETPPRSLQRG